MYHCWYLSIAKGSKSVHPIGQPISHSTHCGFNFPPTWAASVGVLRLLSLGALVSFALCAVGVGHLVGNNPEPVSLVIGSKG